jgi:hypothetical protein
MPDPVRGHDYDDIKPVIEGFGFLSAAEKQRVLAGNVRELDRLSAT